MRAVITIIGADKVGIVHEVTGLMVKYNLNIADINQTIMGGYFTMMMIVDLSNLNVPFDEMVDGFEKFADEIGMQIKVQHEDIFDAMHQL